MSGIDMLRSVQFVADQKSRPAAVQIDIKTWESLLDWLEDLDDRAFVKELLSHLHKGPGKVTALDWDEVSRLSGILPNSSRSMTQHEVKLNQQMIDSEI